MNLPHTEVKFYPEVKSQTGLSSLRVSCKRALTPDLDFVTNKVIFRVHCQCYYYVLCRQE